MDLVVKLMMKTGQFSNDLNTAKTQIQGFKQGFNDTANAVGKVSSGLGGLMKNLASFNVKAAALAGTFKAFKFGVQSSQSYTDLWESRIAGLKGVVKEFANSMATLDFMTFRNGMGSIISSARAAAEAIDNLQDAQAAYGYLSKKYTNRIGEAYNVINDQESTQAEKDAAYNTAHAAYNALKKQTDNFKYNVMDAVMKFVAKEAGGLITPDMLSLNLLDEILGLRNAGPGEADTITKLNTDYQTFKTKYKNADKQYTKYQEDWARDKNVRAYIRAILYRVFSEKMTDTDRDNIFIPMLDQAMTGEQTAISSKRQLNRLDKRYFNTEEDLKGTLDSLREQRDELMKTLPVQKEGTAEWKKTQKEIDTVNSKIKKEEQNVVSALEAYYGVTNSKSMISDFKAILANQKEGTEEWEATSTLIQAANNGLEIQAEKVKDIARNAYGIAYNTDYITDAQGAVTTEAEPEDNKEPNRKSVDGLNELISKQTIYLNSLEAGTDQWKTQYDVVMQLKNELADIQNLTEKINLAAEYKKLTGKDFGDWTMTALNNIPVQQYKQIISVLERVREEYSKTSEEYKKFSDLILLYQERVDAIVGKTDEEAPGTEKWDSFISAMANTSTIVSNLSNAFNTLASESSSSLEEVSASMALMTKNTATNSAAVAAAILQMVSTTLPAISAMIGSISVLAGVEATEKAVSTSKHWIEAIAAVVAIAGTVASAIASAQKLGNMKFATGGIVPGNSYTGDRVVASVNSGEMILNKRQQNTLFRAINSGSIVGSGMNNEVQFKISGTDLVGVLNNNSRKQGLIR